MGRLADRADLAAKINVASAADGQGLLELEVPPRFKLVKLAEVGGTRIHHWSRHDGNGRQVWLQQPRKHVLLELAGWVDHVKSGAAARFDLTPVRVLHVRSSASTIAVEPQPGLARWLMLAAPRRAVQGRRAGVHQRRR